MEVIIILRYANRRGDGTGPAGQGPRTGRGLGNCPQPKELKVETKVNKK